MEVIRGMIVTSVNATVEILVPNHKARQPGWTRMEASGKVLEEIGLEVEGANRIEIKPRRNGNCLMIWHHYSGENERVSKVFGLCFSD